MAHKQYVGTWTTREGVSLKIVDMEDGHLVNTVRYLRRRYFDQVFFEALSLSAKAESYAATAPEGASYAAEGYAKSIMETEGLDIILGEEMPVYLDLLQEVKRRKLEIGGW